MQALRPLFIAALLGCGLAQAGSAVVQFDQPEHYADIAPRQDADQVQQTLRQHLQALADKGLPAGQTLTVTITDIDLAGDVRPAARRLHDVRVLRGQADWPSITLRYSLQDGERQLAQGSERISDMGYLMRSSSRNSSQPLPYEQRLLSDWFVARFGATASH